MYIQRERESKRAKRHPSFKSFCLPYALGRLRSIRGAVIQSQCRTDTPPFCTMSYVYVGETHDSAVPYSIAVFGTARYSAARVTQTVT